MSEHPQLQSWASSAIWPLRSYLLCSPGLYPADAIFFSHIPISSISQSVLVTLTRSTSPSGKIRSAPPYAISPSYCFVDLLFSAKRLAGPSVALPLLHVAFSCNPLHVTFRCPYSTMFALSLSPVASMLPDFVVPSRRFHFTSSIGSLQKN